MSYDHSIEELLSKVGNKFLLTTAVARRAIQIKEGDEPLVENVSSQQPVLAALREFQDEKIVMGISAKDDVSRSEAIFQEDDEDVFQEDDTEEVVPKKVEKKAKKKSLIA